MYLTTVLFPSSLTSALFILVSNSFTLASSSSIFFLYFPRVCFFSDPSPGVLFTSCFCSLIRNSRS
ncbi:hypothetical protein [Sulfolobus polyhedral virus 3]|nr:hypothetical protein [Sulfolobus polyhedral virus 3]